MCACVHVCSGNYSSGCNAGGVPTAVLLAGAEPEGGLPWSESESFDQLGEGTPPALSALQENSLGYNCLDSTARARAEWIRLSVRPPQSAGWSLRHKVVAVGYNCLDTS